MSEVNNYCVLCLVKDKKIEQKHTIKNVVGSITIPLNMSPPCPLDLTESNHFCYPTYYHKFR